MNPTIEQVRARHTGGFFDPENLEILDTEVQEDVFPDRDGGVLFLTKDSKKSALPERRVRGYTIRRLTPSGRITSVSKVAEYPTHEKASRAARSAH